MNKQQKNGNVNLLISLYMEFVADTKSQMQHYGRSMAAQSLADAWPT